jgi:FKBP-type peptidyl-prolyl cis-trans isomerase
LHEQEVGETLDVSYPGDKGGVIKTVLTKGNGPMPKFGQEVEVHYEGFLENGDKFDSSRDRDQRFKFILGAGEVIQGWDCCVGKKR